MRAISATTMPESIPPLRKAPTGTSASMHPDTASDRVLIKIAKKAGEESKAAQKALNDASGLDKRFALQEQIANLQQRAE